MINQIIDFIVFTLDICLERTKFRFQDIEMIEHAADVLLKSSSTEFKVVFFHILGKFGNILIVEKGVLDQLVLVAIEQWLKHFGNCCCIFFSEKWGLELFYQSFLNLITLMKLCIFNPFLDSSDLHLGYAIMC